VSSRNGHKQAVEARKEMARENAQNNVHQQQHAANMRAFDDQGKPRKEYIDAITETDLQPGTIRTLRNLVTKDWVLSNLKEAEVTEEKWLMELVPHQVFAQHPRQGATATGKRRAFELDDDMETLTPLTDQERMQIMNFCRGIMQRIRRSREGWQQEMNSKTISVSETRDQRQQKDGLLSGLFGGG